MHYELEGGVEMRLYLGQASGPRAIVPHDVREVAVTDVSLYKLDVFLGRGRSISRWPYSVVSRRATKTSAAGVVVPPLRATSDGGACRSGSSE
jgi:hypothetical protein